MSTEKLQEENLGETGKEKETPGYYGRLALLFAMLGIYGLYDILVVNQIDKGMSVFIMIALVFLVALLLFFRYGSIKQTIKKDTFALESIELDNIDVYEDLESKKSDEKELLFIGS